LPFAGKPLIAHSLKQSLDCPLIEKTYVSTDDEEIAAVCMAYDVQVIMRPVELSGPAASSEKALIHALDEIFDERNCEPEYVVFLQCT
jgi:N-acylneuraminate cytidylyltransferase